MLYVCVLGCKIIHCLSYCLWNFETCGSSTPNVHSSFQRALQNKRFISTRVQVYFFFSRSLFLFLNGMHRAAHFERIFPAFHAHLLGLLWTKDHHLLLVISKLIFFLSHSLVPLNVCTNYLSFCKTRATSPMRWHEMKLPARK